MKAMAFVVVLLTALLSTAALADVPGLMSYQGTLTDDSGAALDTTVDMTFTIYTSSIGGSVVWTETQPLVEVNSSLFNVLLGSVNTIPDTVFNDPERWLGVQVGTDPELDPRQRIGSVGYAFQSAGDGDWVIDGTDMYSAVSGNVGVGIESPSTALEVNGTVTATAFVGDGSGLTGIAGDNLGNHTATQNIVLGSNWLSGDGGSEGIAVDNTGAVGIGFSSPVAKLDVNGDIMAQTVYKIGGSQVLSVSGTMNTFVGVSAGINNTGVDNTFVGAQAGISNLGGPGNTFIGTGAGYSNTTGNSNTFMGLSAGRDNNASHNTFVGWQAGTDNSSGSSNTFLGSFAGGFNTTGNYNTFVGDEAGRENETGSYNTYIGEDAGWGCTTGSSNVFIGYRAGSTETGSNKLYIANNQFDSNVIISGDFSTGNVGIGTTSPSEKLHVRGSAPVVLIDDQGGGNTHLQFDLSAFEDWEIRTGANGFFFKNLDDDIDYMMITANGRVGIGTTSPSYELDVAGDIECTTLHETSDERLKANIGQIKGALERVRQLRGVSFQWRQEAEIENSVASRHIGVVAQEVEEVFPELVSNSQDGYKSVEYSKLTAVLIEAVKEQQQIIDDQQDQIEELTRRLDDLEE